MRKLGLATAVIAFSALEARGTETSIANPRVDMKAYLDVSRAAARHRESHRVTEAEFVRMAAEPDTIVLDARSPEKYRQLHIAGAVNLTFADISEESLARLLPDKDGRILIYCNNNFVGDESAFPRKLASASLNLSTYVALYDYGYRNVYELAPLLDVGSAKVRLVSGGQTAR
jgi:3-mercaptopyruvate sulfurtransferase SseA